MKSLHCMVESQNRIEFCIILFLRLHEQDVLVWCDTFIDMTFADLNEIFFVSVFDLHNSFNYSKTCKTSFVSYDGGGST